MQLAILEDLQENFDLLNKAEAFAIFYLFVGDGDENPDLLSYRKYFLDNEHIYELEELATGVVEACNIKKVELAFVTFLKSGIKSLRDLSVPYFERVLHGAIFIIDVLNLLFLFRALLRLNLLRYDLFLERLRAVHHGAKEGRFAAAGVAKNYKDVLGLGGIEIIKVPE